MSDSSTLVLGATGKSGRRVVPRLRLRGIPVRAASRSSRTRFDWSDPGSWDAAVAGAAAVYMVAPTVPGPLATVLGRAPRTFEDYVCGPRRREPGDDAITS